MDGEQNPFKEALAAGEGEANPFRPRSKNLTRERQVRTIRDMNLVPAEALDKSPQVADLTVQDLDDLALEFSGLPSRNPKVAELSLDDIQEIEAVFFDFKVAAGKELAKAGRADLTSVDVSCCCCTPCCCCAATDMSETA